MDFFPGWGAEPGVVAVDKREDPQNLTSLRVVEVGSQYQRETFLVAQKKGF